MVSRLQAPGGQSFACRWIWGGTAFASAHLAVQEQCTLVQLILF